MDMTPAPCRLLLRCRPCRSGERDTAGWSCCGSSGRWGGLPLPPAGGQRCRVSLARVAQPAAAEEQRAAGVCASGAALSLFGGAQRAGALPPHSPPFRQRAPVARRIVSAVFLPSWVLREGATCCAAPAPRPDLLLPHTPRGA